MVNKKHLIKIVLSLFIQGKYVLPNFYIFIYYVIKNLKIKLN
jgi:hypothetical protein